MRKEVIGNATLYLGDCVTVLPELRADAIITDPPYGVGLEYLSHEDKREGYKEWCDQWFELCKQSTDGPIAISCGVLNLCNWPEPTWTFCWHKPNSMGRVVSGWNTWEPVLLYGKPLGKKTHDSFTVSVAPQESTGDHPCPKPIGWGVEVIDRVTKPAMTVLDPFMGSGTTGVAAMLTGRGFIGIEVEPRYFDIACQRIENAQRQERLFA